MGTKEEEIERLENLVEFIQNRTSDRYFNELYDKMNSEIFHQDINGNAYYIGGLNATKVFSYSYKDPKNKKQKLHIFNLFRNEFLISANAQLRDLKTRP